MCSLGIGIDCDCPYQLNGNQCNCPTTHYWNGTRCVSRFTINQNCTYDYQCAYATGLICYKVNGYGTCQCSGFYNEYICYLNIIIFM
jgi:hypothetical protein